jgi:hypothetical protein
MASPHSRREFLTLAAAAAAGAGFDTSMVAHGFSRATLRFIIDSHQHHDGKPDYIDRLVAAYRPRNAMACVLTPMESFDSTKRAAAAHPDVVIPYGRISVDDPAAPAQISAFAPAGLRGVKMHNPQRNRDHPGYFHLDRQRQVGATYGRDRPRRENSRS